jgi:IclR family acetate operon transcriptional repressor
MAGNSADSGRSVTSKVVAILLTFNDGTVHSVTEIARLAGLPVSTTHRLVSELAAWGILERTDDLQYRVGAQLHAIGATAGRVPSMAERARRVMEDVSIATHSAVRLGILQGAEVRYIEKTAGHQPVSLYPPTRPVPAHASAMGKAILAFSPPRLVEAMIHRGLTPCTPNTITSGEQLRNALARIRRTRLAISRGELREGHCVMAVPVFGGRSDVVAALEVDVRDLPELRSIHPVLTVAARSLSRELVITHAFGQPPLFALSVHGEHNYEPAVLSSLN